MSAAMDVLRMQAESKTVDERVAEIFGPAADAIVSVVFFAVTIGGAELPLIVVWLIVAAVFFTFYLGFLNLRGVGLAYHLVKGDYSREDDEGEVTHFQALATAVSGTVGVGNIGGVALAISIGGPGATFWTALAGFFGMSLKMAECTLGVKYRTVHDDGSVSGGPMYYLEKGVGAIVGTWTGRALAIFFAIAAMGGAVGGGNMFQANQATVQIISVTGGEDNSPFADARWIIGVAFAIAVGLVIIGGIKSIARVTSKLVPAMAAIYMSACLVVIAVNLEEVPGAFGTIVVEAFAPQSVVGGFAGALIIGFQRAAFSNEAGIGSSSIAHSAVKTRHPATEGHVGMLEPFVDTIVICTTTALVIVITGAYENEAAVERGGVAITSNAFETVIPWFPNVLAIAIMLFALSTMISWAYYGMKATGYLFNDSAKAELVFKVIYCLFTILGASLALGPVIDFSDSMIFLMSVPNVIGLYILARVVKKEIKQYRADVASGEIAPVKADIPK